MNDTSVIGRETVVRGSVRGTGSLEILGRVEGDVSVTGDVTLGEDAAVKGNVSGVHVTVAGVIQGDVRGSEAVTLERGAKVVGDLTAPKISVTTGALVRGVVRTDGEPPLGAARRSLGGQAARPGNLAPKAAAQPVLPAAQPVLPAAQPVLPAAQPVLPAAQPIVAAPQPVLPASRPEPDDDDAFASDEAPESGPIRAVREAPPPPVAPTLAKGAKAKKKKKD